MTSIFKREPVNVDAISSGDALQAIYLDWVNNFISLSRFAEHYGLSDGAAYQLIESAKRVHEDRTERA